MLPVSFDILGATNNHSLSSLFLFLSLEIKMQLVMLPKNWKCSLSLSFQGCVGCKSPPSVPPAAPFDVEIHEMELCSVLDVTEDGATGEKHIQPDTAMDYREAEADGEAQHHTDEDEEEKERTRMTRQVSDQEMAAEEQEVTSQMEEEEGKGGRASDMRH